MRLKELHPARKLLREELAREIDKVHSVEPDFWWFAAMRALHNFERFCQTDLLAQPELSQDLLFWSTRLRELLVSDLVREVSLPSDEAERREDIAHVAETVLLMVSAEMAERFFPEFEPITEHTLPLEEIVAQRPDRFRLSRGVVFNGVPADVLEIKELDADTWHAVPFPLPLDESDPTQLFAHKGGIGRAVLGVIFDAPESMQRAELPVSDFDGVIPVSAPDDWKKRILAIGVDHDGIEMIEPGRDGLLLPFENYALGRDTNSNRVMLSRQGVTYSDDARFAAETGIIKILGHYAPGKAIYGVDRMYMEGFDLSKQRGLARLIKFMVEGKALKFEYLPVSQGLDMGIYVLFLARRFANKQLRRGRAEKFADHLQKMFHVLQQMGQVREGETSIIDVCERAHREYPFFDFESDIETAQDLLLWKLRKFGKQVDREESWKFKMESGFALPRFEGDDVPIMVSLDEFESDETDAAQIVSWWDAFVTECKARTADHPRDDMYEMLFLHSDTFENESLRQD